MSDGNDLAKFSRMTILGLEPTASLRWYSETADTPPRLQQFWYYKPSLDDYARQRCELPEWRDVPTVIEAGPGHHMPGLGAAVQQPLLADEPGDELAAVLDLKPKESGVALMTAPAPYLCDAPKCKERGCDGHCNMALPPDGQWVEWDGAVRYGPVTTFRPKCPVPPGTIIRVRFRDGCEYMTDAPEQMRWAWTRPYVAMADIVAYRVE